MGSIIMLRGINRQLIFDGDEGKARFLETLKKYKDISKYHVHSYCLVNRINLLLKGLEETISDR